MEINYDIDEIIYLPFVVNKIEIQGADFNGVGERITYTLKGKSTMTSSFLVMTEEDLLAMVPRVKRGCDFK